MNNIILTEAFKSLELLEEEAFDISSTTGIEDAKDFVNTDEVVDDSVEVADLYAEDDTELQDSYIGQVILECDVCHSKLFKDPSEVHIDEEDETVANLDEECPYCFSNDGYKVIGQVAPMGQVEEEVETEVEVVEEEPEELPEEEVVEESYIPRKRRNSRLKESSVTKRLKKGNKAVKESFWDELVKKAPELEEDLGKVDDWAKLSPEDYKKLDTSNYDSDDFIIMSDDGKTTSRYIRKASKSKYGLDEDFKDVSVTTDDTHMEMTSDEDGKITVTTEPVDGGFDDGFDDDFDFEDGDEMVAPVDDETMSEIKGEEELPEEELPDEEEIDVDIDEFDEEGFDDLGESYLKKVYENVKSFRTTNVKSTNKNLMIEGIIKFTSGATKKTSFLLEAKDINKKGTIRFIGENKEITRGKKAFTVTGRMDKNKFMCESLRYHYMTKNDKGKSTRVNGTVRKFR